MKGLLRGIALAVILCGIHDLSFAQTISFTPTPVQKTVLVKPKGPKPIKTELSVGLRLNTDGWTIFATKGYVRSKESKQSDLFHNIRFYQVEFSEKKHPKEMKGTPTSGNAVGDQKPKPYVFGKINNFYTFKLGIGDRKMIAGKPESGTVSIHWVYGGGLSIGLLKPYYVDAYVIQDNTGTLAVESIKYSDSTKLSFLTPDFIVGSSGFAKGLGEIKVVPGLHAKTGLHFDFAASRKAKMALEVGVNAEIYSKKIELMANQKAFPYLVNAYLSIEFGKRW
jgi:hypothetical protein